MSQGSSLFCNGYVIRVQKMLTDRLLHPHSGSVLGPRGASQLAGEENHVKKSPSFVRKLVAVGCSALALAAAGSAHAGALAQGVLSITNFFFLNPTTGLVLNESDFSVLVANHT